ncbi:CBS domain-containing protein [Flavicella sp.]|uniref:CBS domain-containing protein n=1 Tax=Flavicella sp. TaxID=2957742 RepID=UPI00301A6F6E
MNLQDYISNDLTILVPEDTIGISKEKTKDQRLSHFPIIKNNKLFGSISESDLSTFEEEDKSISDFQYAFALFFATEDDTLTELLTLFSIHESNILPVLNDKKEYIGFYELNDVLAIYTETPYLKEEGIILILEKDSISYSISEIAQISETNNVSILGLYISKKTEKKTEITIKIKTENINEIIQSYRRYEYNVISNHEDDSYFEDLKNRSNYLQKYLSI